MEGSKAAYQQAEFIDDRYYTTPVHGDRPWEYAHLDHTEMDVKLRHSRIKKKKFRRKAWLTLLIDSRTRRVLASHKSFEKPSRVSCMMVIRDCVLRHGRLPDCIVVDGGSEFISKYFEKLLARYNCDIQWRPPTKPRFGSIIERFIHTLNKQLLHNLLGNTKIMKRARQVTKEVDPDTHAVWTLPLLDEALDRYFYEEYDTREHSSLGQSPREAFNELMEKFNPPSPYSINYDQIFLIETMIPVKRGALKVQQSRGIKVFGTWYKCREFRDPVVIGTKVPVHLDPDDVSHVYAYVKNRWIECFARARVLALLRGKSIRLMRIISIEERERSRSYYQNANVRLEELARCHSTREETEREEQQRLADEEAKEITARKERLKLIDVVKDHRNEAKEIGLGFDDEPEQNIVPAKLLTFKRTRRR
ncbi:MAG TPA: transposase family protein [Pyrinomonadaceae bacterium]|nr:transposase family protein [Pyrinomonadaceae bacterium]